MLIIRGSFSNSFSVSLSSSLTTFLPQRIMGGKISISTFFKPQVARLDGTCVRSETTGNLKVDIFLAYIRYGQKKTQVPTFELRPVIQCLHVDINKEPFDIWRLMPARLCGFRKGSQLFLVDLESKVSNTEIRTL